MNKIGSFNPGHPTEYVENFIKNEGYNVEKVIAFSGLSTVVLVTDMKSDTKKIIKVFFGYYNALKMVDNPGPHLYAYKFYKTLSDQEECYWLEKFKQEALILSQLNSSYWVKVLSTKLNALIPYYIMEYIPGENLSVFMKNKGIENNGRTIIDIGLAVNIVTNLLQGLSQLHDIGIIHRDITPYNIIMKGNKPILCDLGYARNINKPMFSNQTKQPFQYWPPEHEIKFNEVDASGDLYSIGVIMYEMLTGTLPRYNSPPISYYNSMVENDLESIVNKLLSYYPNGRYQSTKECLHAIDSIRLRMV